ncbi:hypothetical protein [Hahella ganghwensis]|uniref:hypothetical protein n=1 Tax=Hahella ganghwensis TaxID=286420 RepID=UPI000372656E|nr:hypothetical protein [Hahella ganghwensis]
MTLQQAINQVNALAPKSAGQLIKHTDWNALITSIATIGTAVSDNQTRLDLVEADAQALRNDLTAAIARLDTVEEDLDELRGQIAPLLDQYLVRTSCERIRYAMGEVCVITAEVTTLTGEPIEERPWVDFVSSWGRLRQVPGFTSRAGVGDNSVSVRVNNEGIAQVQLRADHTEGFTDTEEQEVQGSLQTLVEVSNTTIAQTLLAANSPTEFTAQAAFKALSKEYERADTNAMRSYVDTYFVRMPEYQIRPIRPNPFPSWRDYRATVMAMAKPDGDPTTADYSRGASSIQITFRDWINYWINDYVLDINPGVIDVIPDLEPIFTKPIGEATLDFEGLMAEKLIDKGVIGRMKTFDTIREAIGQLGGVTDPVMTQFKDQVTNAVAVQGANDINQWVYSVNTTAAQGIPTATAFLSMQKQSAGLGDEIHNLTGKVQETENVTQSIAVLEGRMQAAENVGVNIDQRLNLINDSVKAINVFDDSSIQFGVNKITADIELIRNQLGS